MSLQTRTLKIEGMHCGSCGKKIRSSLLQTDGVEDAVVSPQDATARVSLRTPTDETGLRQAVEDAGNFRVTAIGLPESGQIAPPPGAGP